ncbi:hypothetical protein COX58_03045 [archaeon CG_4_10_14_0_2_um_filter_Archaea_38_6]|nr:MAG: hypothetical protein COS83_04035 [archaeon CG07_land_8_20_14_0_80_38_8]PIU88439.1 MAG: hypothetical protein COS64_03750 [archaeon CG06_land_8_20_14_3_00_37_11]PJA21975.1 MAG: hypothetical protein COX58_03045 [archaeon CG_4_10_14_0_2_um_filter_Archaea_38_6]
MELICLTVLGLLYFVLFISCFWLIVFLDNMSELKKDPNPKKKYFISAIVPAYNEEKTIAETINSLLKQNYPRKFFEIIVINDGSTDATRKKCEEYSKKGLIRLINQKNGGKANAMNNAIKRAKGELIYVLDADSCADENSFKHLIGYFDNPRVAAVTSSMRVTCKESFLQKIQWVEYLFSILMRKIMSLFNCLYVTPGPGSIYRKKVIKEIGGFSEETLTEDMEIAFNIQHHNYVIENSLNSTVLTNTPDKLTNLIKQRRRWYTGFIEDSTSYKHFYFNKSKGFLGRFLLPANVLTTIALIFLTSYSVYTILDSFFVSYSNIGAVEFNFLSMIQPEKLPLLIYGINLYTIMGLIFMIVSIIIIYFSLKTSDEEINLKNNFLNYIFYLFFYSLLMTLFWTDSIIYKLMFRKNNKGWKYG